MFHRAEKGDVIAQLKIAEIFKEAAEQPLALPWYERAAKAGNSQALYALSFFYEGAYSDVEAEEGRGEECLQEAVEMRNPDAIYKIYIKWGTNTLWATELKRIKKWLFVIIFRRLNWDKKMLKRSSGFAI